jgi:O-antigen/teichoic acid export membrane protein
MLYALHRTGVPLAAKAVGVGLTLLALYPLCRWLGLEGAGLAYLLGTLISIGGTVAVLGREYRRARSG